MSKKEEKKSKVKKTVERKVVPNKKADVFVNRAGEEKIVVIDEKTFYTFTNRRPGLCFFTREDGKEDKFEGFESLDNITEKERKALKATLDFKNGWLVEEAEEVDDIPVDAWTDEATVTLIQEGSIDDMKKHINGMSSDFAVKRVKELLIKYDAPSSLSALCDYKLKEIEEAYQESMEAPLDSYGKKKLV